MGGFLVRRIDAGEAGEFPGIRPPVEPFGIPLPADLHGTVHVDLEEVGPQDAPDLVPHVAIGRYEGGQDDHPMVVEEPADLGGIKEMAPSFLVAVSAIPDGQAQIVAVEELGLMARGQSGRQTLRERRLSAARDPREPEGLRHAIKTPAPVCFPLGSSFGVRS